MRIFENNRIDGERSRQTESKEKRDKANREFIIAGKEAFKCGDFVNAERLFCMAIDNGLKHLDPHRQLSRIYFRTGDYKKSLFHAKHWLNLDADNPKPYILILKILTIEAEHAACEDIAKQLLDFPDNEESITAAAFFYRDKPEHNDVYSSCIDLLKKMKLSSGPEQTVEDLSKFLSILNKLGENELFDELLESVDWRTSFELGSIKARNLVQQENFEDTVRIVEGLAGDIRKVKELKNLLEYAKDRHSVNSGGSVEIPARIADRPDSNLIETLKKTGAREFVIFHVDHFEPFGQVVQNFQLDFCAAFAHEVARHDYTQKLTLFYRPDAIFVLTDKDSKSDSDLEMFGVRAIERPPRDQKVIRETLAPLVEETGAEFHLHIHHEDLIPVPESYGDIAPQILRQLPEEKHNSLLELHVKANIAQIERDTGIKLTDWATVHGKWALNGSDRNVCRIDDEIERLMALGCWGDFTFPAGRRHCTPHRIHPYSIIPTTSSKCYDRLDADVIILNHSNGPEVVSPNRFMIWSCPIEHYVVSLDYYSPNSSIAAYDVSDTLRTWINGGIRFGGAIIVKTHAHSMCRDYYNPDNIVFPHFFPRNQRLFATLELVCEHAGVELRYETANEIRRRLAI